MSSIANKVKDAVGLGSHDSKDSSSLTGHSASSNGANTVADNSQQTSTTNQDTLNPNTSTQTAPHGRKLSDAAQMPPSAFRQHAGEPTIEHDYPEDSTTKRHSVSHQENHYMR